MSPPCTALIQSPTCLPHRRAPLPKQDDLKWCAASEWKRASQSSLRGEAAKMFCTYDSYDSDEGMVELSIRDFWLLVGGLFWVAGEPLCRDVCVCVSAPWKICSCFSLPNLRGLYRRFWYDEWYKFRLERKDSNLTNSLCHPDRILSKIWTRDVDSRIFTSCARWEDWDKSSSCAGSQSLIIFKSCIWIFGSLISNKLYCARVYVSKLLSQLASIACYLLWMVEICLIFKKKWA